MKTPLVTDGFYDIKSFEQIKLLYWPYLDLSSLTAVLKKFTVSSLAFLKAAWKCEKVKLGMSDIS